MRNTVRLMTAVSPELNERLEKLCKAYGLSKSGLIAYYVGKSVDLETRSKDLISTDTINNMMTQMFKNESLPVYTSADLNNEKNED